MENQLRRALKEEQFELYYQPVVNTAMDVVGVEALIRWDHPEMGMVAPIEFLDVLETSGQIVEVGGWVIETALKQLTLWREQGLAGEDFLLCINISPRQFRDRQFAENIKCQLERINVRSENVIMEVTEHNLIHDIDDAILRMRELIQRGISFSLDDFGTGYSSLAHLKNLPVSHIKVDRSFVKDICDDSGDQAMVASILALSKHLGLEVVAEGVEDIEQFHLLKQYGCKFYQGYFFSKPLSNRHMTSYLETKQPAA